jgi:hypothetical protein
MNVEIRKLRRAGELERYVEYASRDDGDSVLVVLDSDDFCPAQIVAEFSSRVLVMHLRKPVAIAFFRSEYESIFLICIEEIVRAYPEFGWSGRRPTQAADLESVRNAKGHISKLMNPSRAYKETRDQARFTSVVDFDRLRRESRSFRHLESAINWLRSANKKSLAYPSPSGIA